MANGVFGLGLEEANSIAKTVAANRQAKQYEKWLQELEKSGVKYTKENVVMITKTPDGKLMWLETGNQNSGLEHIISRHQTEFTKRGINDIQSHLEATLKTVPVETGPQNGGYYSIYTIDGKNYTVAYGTNGYIVSFYPSN